MERKTNKYPLNQSPLYKIVNHKQLAKVLSVEYKTLKSLIKGEGSYYFTQTPDKKRDLEIPKPQLKRVHIRINNLLSRIEAPSYLSSGVKQRSNATNAKMHIGDKALLKIDIKKFYPSTTFSMVEKCFVKTFKCSKDIAETLASIVCVNGHIPTGSPISQSIAYYSNIAIFNHIDVYAKARNITFSLYVDDLTFSGKVIPKDFLTYIKAYIERNRGYSCHKIRRYNSSTPKIVTGFVIIGSDLKILNRHRKKISDQLGLIDELVSNHAIDSVESINYFQSLIGSLFSAGQVNGRYYQKGKELVAYRKQLGVKALN